MTIDLTRLYAKNTLKDSAEYDNMRQNIAI